jgi:cyclohexanone monooxygenase
MQFKTELTSASFDESTNRWQIQTSTNETFTSKYLVTALGLLSKQNFPNIPGISTFKGLKYHTGNFPQSYDFTGKRVGVIGCGSTGVQVITALGKAGQVKSLTCFQRHPQYSVPSGDGPVSSEYREGINGRYDEIWKQVKDSVVAFGFEESTVKTFDVDAEEREKIYQRAWDRGNGFRFMFWTFCDITYDEAANEEACKFMRRKIAETVKDPEKARKLTPHDFYARRPLCDSGYYQVFNKVEVDIVDLKETPIKEIVETGIKTGDGVVHELDVIIFATGFDAVDGNYTRLAIKGRGGVSLKVSTHFFCHKRSPPSPPITHLFLLSPSYTHTPTPTPIH